MAYECTPSGRLATWNFVADRKRDSAPPISPPFQEINLKEAITQRVQNSKNITAKRPQKANVLKNSYQQKIFEMNRCALGFPVAGMKGTLEVGIMYEGTVLVAESSKSIFPAGGCNLKGTQSPA